MSALTVLKVMIEESFIFENLVYCLLQHISWSNKTDEV